MASASSPMPTMSTAAATPNFELPAMPGSYEDFEFSLNLPENITASDLNLVASPDFSHFFGLSSNAGPSGSILSSTGMTPGSSTAPSFGNISELPSSSTTMSGTIMGDSAPATPKGRDMDDTVMSHSTATSTDSATTATAAEGFAPGMSFSTKTEPQTTSMPQSSSVMHNPAQQQPSVYDAQQIFGGSTDGNAGNNLAMLQNILQQQPQAQMQAPIQQNSNGLFDANETSFLTNFLSGFEGWDFNPNLPMDLPSFADAEKLAFQYGSPQAFSPIGGGGSGGRGSRQRSGASMRNAKGSPHATFNNYAPTMVPTGSMYGQQDVPASALMMMQQQQHPGWHVPAMADAPSSDSKKKMKTAHGRSSNSVDTPTKAGRSGTYDDGETDKRSNHILSEQRRRNHIREAFKELVDMLEAGRDFGARGLGLSSGAGTGIEDEGLDDRSDYESTLEDEEPSAATKRRKLKARKRAALEAARKAGARDPAAAAALLNGGVGRGKGRGRGGSAGGGAGSKSAVLFQAVDLLHWLNGRNSILTKHVQQLEEAVVQAK